jgi:hypothetical protein
MEPDHRELSLPERCQEISQHVEAAIESCGQDTAALLSLLRVIEQLHRSIFNEHFVPSLPNSRQALYALLREMEAEGGWPYIPKMRIYELIDYLNAQAAAIADQEEDDDADQDSVTQGAEDNP